MQAKSILWNSLDTLEESFRHFFIFISPPMSGFAALTPHIHGARDEERGLPDWYTKRLEEDLHGLGLPNRPEILGSAVGW